MSKAERWGKRRLVELRCKKCHTVFEELVREGEVVPCPQCTYACTYDPTLIQPHARTALNWQV
jgi:protein-arginine kinase activator protein McsA